jgi:small-conductance mechanosensitive channel
VGIEKMIQQTTELLLNWVTGHGLRVVVILLAAAVTYRALNAAMARLETVISSRGERFLHEQRRRAVTLANVFRSLGLIVILVVGGLLTLEEFGVDITPLLAGASIVGLAIGLGSQTLVRDMIGGLFILLEDQYHVGDTIRVGGVSGMVEQITLRVTHLRDTDGTVHMVPNGEIRIVSNATSGWSRAVVDVRAGNDQLLETVMEAVRAAVDETNKDASLKPLLLEPVTISGVEALDADAVRVRVTAKTTAGQQETVNRALRERIRKVFEARKITGHTGA